MTYLHGTAPGEQRRLEAQHSLLGGASFLLPIDPRMRVLDVGCGTGAVARELAPLLSRGHIVGLDREPEQIDYARRQAIEKGLTDIEFRTGEAEVLPFADGAFDLVFCRFLLEHVREPAAVLREMARVVRPNGTVVACECKVDCCATTSPPLPHARQALEAMYQLQTRHGGHPRIGEELGALLCEVGLRDVVEDVLTSPMSAPEELRQYAAGGASMLRTCELELLAGGLLGREDLDLAYAEWARLPETPGATANFRVCRARGIRHA